MKVAMIAYTSPIEKLQQVVHNLSTKIIRYFNANHPTYISSTIDNLFKTFLTTKKNK